MRVLGATRLSAHDTTPPALPFSYRPIGAQAIGTRLSIAIVAHLAAQLPNTALSRPLFSDLLSVGDRPYLPAAEAPIPPGALRGPEQRRAIFLAIYSVYGNATAAAAHASSTVHGGLQHVHLWPICSLIGCCFTRVFTVGLKAARIGSTRRFLARDPGTELPD
jgi:hypothetical protein